MKNQSLAHTLILAGLLLACSPVQAQLLPVDTLDRPWVHESEFDANSRLHALEGQTVLLDLEPAERPGPGNGGPPGKHPGSQVLNSFRFFVENERAYRLCIPSEEPHLKHLRVFGTSRPNRPLIQAKPGGRCNAVTLTPGSYRIEIHHKVDNLDHGKTAFFRLPDETLLTGDPATSATAELLAMAWKGSNGKFVQAPNGKGNLVATGTTVGQHSIWQVAPGSPFQLYDGTGKPVKSQAGLDEPGIVDCPRQIFLGSGPPSLLCASFEQQFYFANASATRFQFIGVATTTVNGVWYAGDSGYSLNGSQQLVSSKQAGDNGEYWNVDYRFMTCLDPVCDESQLQLQKGEVALFAKANYQWGAYVFAESAEDFSIYSGAANVGLGIGDNQVRSLRVGPDTVAVLHADANFGGATYVTDMDMPSLSGFAVGPDELSSLQIDTPRNYVIDSNGCKSCDLRGIDLSGLDLSGANFNNSNLAGANLTDTNLFGAQLDDTTLSAASLDGADFTDASLRCTNLSDIDLTAATFETANDAIAAVSDSTLAAIVGVDVKSGSRFIISDSKTGGGTALKMPGGLDSADEGLLLIDENRLLSIQDGHRTLVSSNSAGTGTEFVLATDVAFASDGSIYVGDAIKGAIFSVDPDTGNRTVLSSSSVGGGPILVNPIDLTVSDQGDLYVTDFSAIRIITVDPATGHKAIVSDSLTTGSGPKLQQPYGITVDADGSLLLVDAGIPALLRIDPATGKRSRVSGGSVGSGPAFSGPTGVAVKSNGEILVADPDLPGLILVNPDSGDRVLFSDSGDGLEFLSPNDVSLTGSASLTSRIATDLSCRLSLARSIVDIDSFPAELWRYMDLTDATINGASGTTLSTADDPLDLSGAMLNGADLSGVVLDSANMGCVTTSDGEEICTSLQSVNLVNASLKNANLSRAQLQGASLARANLDGANLSDSKLLARTGGSPASLSGAFMRGVDLSNADLSGVIANNVNFYSIAGATADASNAVMTGAKFINAYLAGADFSDATLQSTVWTQAVLVGANFTGADLSKNETAGEVTDFGSAYLQGTVFANASVADASFDGSYWDVDGVTTELNIQLQTGNITFAGYWDDASMAQCAQARYPSENFPSASTPATNSSNICPDGSLGNATFGCNEVWENALIPIGSTTPAGAIDPALPGSCASTDLCWIIVSSFCVP